MDPISLSLLAISALSTGLGLFKESKANTKAAQASSAAIDKQASQNKIDRLNGDADYLQTLDDNKIQEKAAAAALVAEQAKKAKTIRIALYATGAVFFLIAMTIIFFKRKTNKPYA